MDIMIAGVGGQGTLLASRVLGKYALDKGFDCKLSEVHGMAQRGGSVVTYVKIGKKIYSPLIDLKSADILLAFEKLEALRYSPYVKDDGIIMYSTQEMMPLPVVIGAAKYPDDIESRLKNAVAVDAPALAEQAGSVKCANTVMLGAFAKRMEFDREEFLSAVLACIPQKTIELNKTAFDLGYRSL